MARLLMPCLKYARRTFRYSSTVNMPPPSLLPERANVADFYAARRGLIPPLPWPTFSPPFSAGVVGRIFSGRSKGEAVPMTNDRFEAAACVAVHDALPRDAALADPEFWIWMATGPGLDLIRRRYPGKGEAQIPDRLNFTSASARETFFYRLWVRAELAHDTALADPYELARYGDIDFWRSHVFRQMSTESGPLLAAFIRFQHPDGPDGEKRLTQDEIRALVKNMRRVAANMLVETLDEQEAARFVEEQWRKIQSTRSQQAAAE